MGLGYGRITIGSNDTLLDPGSLAGSTRLPPPKEDEAAIWHLCDWNFFAINVWAISKVGWFDENFYPAYKEDQDYAYRCRLAGVQRKDLPGARAPISARRLSPATRTTQLNREHALQLEPEPLPHEVGRRLDRDEVYHALRQARRDLRWWPDPCDTITRTNWDNARRERAMTFCGNSMSGSRGAD